MLLLETLRGIYAFAQHSAQAMRALIDVHYECKEWRGSQTGPFSRRLEEFLKHYEDFAVIGADDAEP